MRISSEKLSPDCGSVVSYRTKIFNLECIHTEFVMKKLVNDVGNLLREFGFEAYWPNDPIPLSDLNTPIKKPKQVEIDIIAKISSVGFLVEVTTQLEKNKRKIEKFILKYRAVKKSILKESELVSLFSGVSKGERRSFDGVKEWRALYFGTSPELIHEKLAPDQFHDSAGLSIINVDDWDYIKTLEKAVGKYARFEFWSFLGLNPNEIEGIEDIDEYFRFHRVERRKITKGALEADIFQFEAPPSFLLRTCKVFRFYGLLLRDAKTYYQRMLKKKKLEEIRKFIGRSTKRCFPTPITVVLPPQAEPRERDGKKLAIPYKYGTIDIIDGQHRVYAYASSKISKKVLKKARLLVNGIRFHTDDPKEIMKFSANTFIDINREQMKVKTSLLYSISYDVMGDKSSESLAGKVILNCNSDKYSPLHDLFEARALKRKSKLGLRRTSIVEVTKALAKVIEDIRRPNSIEAKNAAKMIGKTSLSRSANKLIEVSTDLLNRYFNRVQKVLSKDWVDGTKSVIFRSKYMAAFILLLRDSIGKGYSFTEVEKRLRKISDNIKSPSEWKNSASQIDPGERDQLFHKKRGAIPLVKFSTASILKGLKWYEEHDGIWPKLRKG